MIVFCCGMSRSGSTVQYQIAKEVVESKGVGTGMGHSSSRIMQMATSTSSNHIHVIKSEQCQGWMARMLTMDTAIGIGIYRDFRDVVASLMWFYSVRASYLEGVIKKGSFKEVIKTTAKQAILWQSAWEILPNVTFVRYEDMWPNLGDMTEWVAKLMGVDLSDAEVEAIKEKFTLENNKQRIKEQEEWIDLDGSMLTKAHISPFAGRPGRWMEILDDRQLRQCLKIGGQWLRNHGYNISD